MTHGSLNFPSLRPPFRRLPRFSPPVGPPPIGLCSELPYVFVVLVSLSVEGKRSRIYQCPKASKTSDAEAQALNNLALRYVLSM